MNHFYLRFKPSSHGVRFIISVSKKVSTKAVVRNRIRRRIRPVLQELTHSLSPAEYTIVALPGAESVKGDELKVELAHLFKKR